MTDPWQRNLDVYLENTLDQILPGYQAMAYLPPSIGLPFTELGPTLPAWQRIAIELKAIHEQATAILGTSPNEGTYQQATEYVDGRLREMAFEQERDAFSDIIKRILGIT